MPKNQELKNLINKIKYERDLTQADISKIIGVGKTYISDMLNGRVPYTDSIKEKLEGLLEHNSTIIGNENIVGNVSSHIDARKYYSDSPDILKAQICQMETVISDKEEQVRTLTEQVRTLTEQVRTLTEQVRTLTSSLAKKDEQISKLIEKIK